MIINLKWNDLINHVKQQEGKEITIKKENWNIDNPEYNKILELWKQADFNFNAIAWTNYYPKINFDYSWVEDIKDKVNLNGIHRAWISRINPGFYAPWHWDIDDNIDSYKEKGEILRYSIFIGKPNLCHVFVNETSCYTMQTQGTCVKWSSYDEWHAGMNAGLKPKFMFHIVGY